LRRPWQDWVLSSAEAVFLISLLPSLLGPDKPAALTSAATAIMLCGILAVNASKRWWMACGMLTFTVAAWATLFFQVAL
jgi:hypothetical protein